MAFFTCAITCMVLYLSLLGSLEKGFVESQSSQGSYTVKPSSLLPSSNCNPSSKVHERSKSLKVVHKYGPCVQLLKEQKHVDIAEEILRQDQSRVNSIRSHFNKRHDTTVEESAATTLPAKSGLLIGSGNYFVTVGLGTPKRELSLTFDTGSSLTWTQCQPCAGQCYSQKDPIFDPSQSSSYVNETCSSSACSAVRNSCSDPTSTCIYGVLYGDNSITSGFLAQETLTLTSSDVIKDFIFGCGQENTGLFNGAAGLLGLGRNSLSIVQQAAQKHNRLFSYCLPTASSSTGHLTFGAAVAAAPQYTPMLTPSSSLYGIQITGISVAGTTITEAEPSLKTTRTILDSGTVITRLPKAAYSAVRAEFRKYMAKYPAAAPGGSALLDTCYDLSGVSGDIEIPRMSISLGRGVTLNLTLANTLFVSGGLSRVCLAFAGEDGEAIFGNVQQKGFDVVYDVAGARIGFSPGGC